MLNTEYTAHLQQHKVCRAGYIIGRGVRVVEWDVTESPTGPTGHLVSMKLRALTPDGIRIAIAKEFGLSNYREVKCQECCVLTRLLICVYSDAGLAFSHG